MSSAISKRRLKMWLHLFAATRVAEGKLREFLRTGLDTTLPRFDVMAALWRRPKGVSMSELSRMLLVSNGNATAVVDRLEKDGLVLRTPSETDRRTIFVSLTEQGRTTFETWAIAHEAEVDRIFDHLDEPELELLTNILMRIEGAK